MVTLFCGREASAQCRCGRSSTHRLQDGEVDVEALGDGVLEGSQAKSFELNRGCW